MSAHATSPQPARLIDCVDPLFVFVLHLQQLPDAGAADALRVRVNEMIQTAATAARGLGASEDAVTNLRYACVALMDEVVLTSSWPLKDTWLGRPLQMEHFGNFAAGEEFFTRLDAIRAGNDPFKLDLAEIFATAIALGFRGKHVGVQGLETLRGIQRAVIADLGNAAAHVGPQRSVSVSERDVAVGTARRKTDPADLSPSWRPPHEPLLGGIKREVPVRLILVICAALLLTLYLVLAGVLRHWTSAITGS